MAQLPTTRRITQEELQGTAEQQIRTLIGPMNLFFTDIYSALNRDLTFGENIDAQIITVDLSTNSTYPTLADWQVFSFRLTMRRQPRGAIVISTQESSNTDAVFTSPVHADVIFPASEGIGKIRFVSGLQASKRYNLTLLIV